MICSRCGTNVPDTVSECSSCGMPTIFMNGEDREASSGDDRAPTTGEGRVTMTGEVLEPEVLESLDDVDQPGFRGTRNPQINVQPVGCTLGPGCGCIGLPLLALAGVVVSSAIALLWVLSLGRLPVSLLALASRARRGFTRT